MTTSVRGRPRDPRVDEAVTQKLVELLAERGPYGFSVEELAASCGVGKAAIYRRYRSREELLVSGFRAVNEDMPDVSELPVRQALITLLEWISGAHAAGMTPTWLVSIQQMPQLRNLYFETVIKPRREALRHVVMRAVDQAIFRPDLDVDVALTCLSSPAVMMGMHQWRDCQFAPVRIEDVVDTLVGGMLNPEARASDW